MAEDRNLDELGKIAKACGAKDSYTEYFLLSNSTERNGQGSGGKQLVPQDVARCYFDKIEGKAQESFNKACSDTGPAAKPEPESRRFSIFNRDEQINRAVDEAVGVSTKAPGMGCT